MVDCKLLCSRFSVLLATVARACGCASMAHVKGDDRGRRCVASLSEAQRTRSFHPTLLLFLSSIAHCERVQKEMNKKCSLDHRDQLLRPSRHLRRLLTGSRHDVVGVGVDVGRQRCHGRGDLLDDVLVARNLHVGRSGHARVLRRGSRLRGLAARHCCLSAFCRVRLLG